MLSSGPSGNGPWRVQIDYVIENFGNVRLDDLTMTDDLEDVFGVANVDWDSVTVLGNVAGSGCSWRDTEPTIRW